MNFEEQIAGIKNLGSKRTYPLYYENKMQEFNVYDIPTDYLKLNPVNTRIFSKKLELDSQKETKLDDIEIQERIEEWIWSSDIIKNKKTKQDIELKSQEKPAVITRDGLVVSGNRRLTIIRRINKEKGTSLKLKCIILNRSYADSKQSEIDIRRLEYSLQTGEDEKVNYDPIEKHLSAYNYEEEYINNGLLKREVAANDLNYDSLAEFNKSAGVGKLMRQYLEHHGYPEKYSRLYGKTELLEKLFTTYNAKKTSNRSWDASEADIEDYKLIGFDLVRWVYNSEKEVAKEWSDARALRDLYFTNSRTKNTVFSNREVFKNFKAEYEELEELIEKKDKSVKEIKEEYNISDQAAAEKKDKIFANDPDISNKIRGILGKAQNSIADNQKNGEPEKYLLEAYEKLNNLLKDKYEFERNPRDIAFKSDMIEILNSDNQRDNNLRLANYLRKIGDELKKVLE
jgi:hypothetical protein